MIARSTIGIALVALLTGVGSYVATVTMGARGDAERGRGEGRGLARWLALSPEQEVQLRADDPTFHAECRALHEEWDAARDELANALADESATDAEILAAVEKAIDVHTRLERRVAQHLLKVRKHLTPEQRRRLFEFSAEQVRQGPQYGRGGGGWRGGGRGGPPTTRPEGGGRGAGGGQGPPWRNR